MCEASARMPSPTLAKVDDRIAGAAQQALQTLLKNRKCASFVSEVDPEQLGLVNYFEVVTEPMCLELVGQKLQVTLTMRSLAHSHPLPCRKKHIKLWVISCAMWSSFSRTL